MRTAFILTLLFLAGCGTMPPNRIIAYVYKDTDIPRIGAQKLTHINYAFGLVSVDGEAVLPPDAPARLTQLQALKAQNSRLKIILSIGGWGADHFSDAALTEDSREKFASSAVAIVKQYALDGVDLDWEYPGQPGPGIRYRPEDKQNFTLLLKKLRERLGTRTLLTIASSAGDYFEHTEMDKLHRYLDWINIMTYDFAGAWTPVTGHHAALYWNPAAGASGPHGASYVQQHLAAGIPPSKLVLGVPFYGRGWTGVSPLNNGFHQPYENAVEYPWSAIRTLENFQRHWDDHAQAPFLWNPLTRTFISYDDPQSLRAKAEFIRKHHLGGFMYWEHSQDPDEELLDVLVSALGTAPRK